MANFNSCFERVLELEGGYLLHTVPGDRGGMTYAGISRVHHPNWEGWALIDRGKQGAELENLVKSFFRIKYWNKIQGDSIIFESAAYNIYAFGINAGMSTAIQMCQKLIGATVDGSFGPKTLSTLNAYIQDAKDERIFALSYSLMKIFRDNEIVMHDSRRRKDILVSNRKFLSGWINRTKAGLKHWGITYP